MRREGSESIPLERQTLDHFHSIFPRTHFQTTIGLQPRYDSGKLKTSVSKDYSCLIVFPNRADAHLHCFSNVPFRVLAGRIPRPSVSTPSSHQRFFCTETTSPTISLAITTKTSQDEEIVQPLMKTLGLGVIGPTRQTGQTSWPTNR